MSSPMQKMRSSFSMRRSMTRETTSMNFTLPVLPLAEASSSKRSVVEFGQVAAHASIAEFDGFGHSEGTMLRLLALRLGQAGCDLLHDTACAPRAASRPLPR